jgi:hypothetical protein
MKIVARNKRKMSNAYSASKTKFLESCRIEDDPTHGLIISQLRKMVWCNGEWYAIIYHSVYGDTYNYITQW